MERIRCSEDVLHIYWTSYVRSIYILCLRGIESFSWAYWSKMQFKIRVKIKRGFLCFSNFWLTITSFALFFYQYWNSLSFSILSQLFCARTENCYQRSCGFYVKLSDKSLMGIRKNNQPRTEPFDAPYFNFCLTKTWWIENGAFIFRYFENMLLFCDLEQLEFTTVSSPFYIKFSGL